MSVWNIDKTVEHTVNWYKNYLENNSLNSLDDLKTYIEDAHKLSLNWAKGSLWFVENN